MKQRINEGLLFKLPMTYRYYRGTEWEVIDADSIVWALTWSERSAEAIADAINERHSWRLVTP